MDPDGVFTFLTSYLEKAGGWPVARCAELTAYMKKHVRTPSCQGILKISVALPDAPACLVGWDSALQAKVGAESWVGAVRKNAPTIGATHWDGVGMPHLYYSATTDFWFTLIPISELLDQGIALPDVEHFLEKPSGQAMMSPGGSATTLFLQKEKTLYVPAGVLPIIYFFHQDPKTPDTLGFLLQVPLFFQEWSKDIGEREVQAIANFNVKWLSQQSKDMYKQRCTVSTEFFTACGAKV